MPPNIPATTFSWCTIRNPITGHKNKQAGVDSFEIPRRYLQMTVHERKAAIQYSIINAKVEVLPLPKRSDALFER
jgi:hypothetical protein